MGHLKINLTRIDNGCSDSLNDLLHAALVNLDVKSIAKLTALAVLVSETLRLSQRRFASWEYHSRNSH